MSVLIIAEAGVNHNGDINLAKKLVLEAKNCGADIVKFQTAKLESLVSKYAKMAEYQVENIGKEESQLEMLRRLILPFDQFVELSNYCKEVGIEFLSTPFDIESIKFLDELGCSIWKVPSGEITNYPYLVRIARTRKPIIMSTGMSTMDEIAEALTVLRDNGASKITLLHCTTEYPAPLDEVNLKAMETLRDQFDLEVGYSDHTEGIEIPLAAVGMGATVIEKHFTLDRNMEGPDHKASLEPAELKAMVEGIRRVEKALGDGEKKPSPSEIKNKEVARKSIVAKKAIKAGEIFSEENITTKRPGTGISPMHWPEIIGTMAVRNFEEDEVIEL
ncbi:MAG: N-acetylneuraminate synthase [Lachnospiraceae bacterium]|nr:N-acetylneuraminate synthase [Lachnospiraceae bacterium]